VSAGTGACAAIPGYSVAGKTGTAHKAIGGTYSSGTMASFIGYAPASQPRLAAIVVLDEPATEYGGTAAAPVFSDVMQFALTRSGVAPDDSANAQYNAAQASAAASGTECTKPAAAARRAEEIAAAQAAAEQAAATTTTTVPRATTASKKRRPAPRTGTRVAAPPDSLPPDTSQSG